MATLTEAITRDILAERPATVVSPTCFACGRSYGKGAPKADGSGESRFCSVRCRDAFDAGFPPYEAQSQRAVMSVPLTSWVTMAGPPGTVGRRPYARDLPSSGGGCLIPCRACRREFVSKGLRCCSAECERAYREREDIAKTMAERGMEPIADRKRQCAECGKVIPLWRNGRKVSAATKYCSHKCGQRARTRGDGLSSSSNPVSSVESAQKPPSNGLSVIPSEISSTAPGPSLVTVPVDLVGGGSFRFGGARLDPEVRTAVVGTDLGGSSTSAQKAEGCVADGIVPDLVHAGMYRVRGPDGTLSDLLSLSRACALARRLVGRRVFDKRSDAA